MNSLVQWSQKILPMLRRLEEGQIEPQDALQECICIIKEVLSDYGVPQNIQNAGQIANLINAHISPDDPLSKWMWPRIESGKLPEFSTNDPTENALERGVAILMSSMQESFNREVPKGAAITLFEFIEERGFLPQPNDVTEY